ncbi:hypothetical protein CHS0354_015156 [Potamilus streckersoni]|uniref:Uncharacterized protein n=1 Tax=Potamilus streckersoni TaxID=2493646 RepID=A0AAE0SD20_9BIVA|nr:hypothetical protein CHS0354_015156 [Potamilus streckersoni]
MTLLKENENLKYDDLVSCIELLSIRGVEIDDKILLFRPICPPLSNYHLATVDVIQLLTVM